MYFFFSTFPKLMVNYNEQKYPAKMLKPNVIPATEAAREKGCSVQTVYNALDRGDLNGVRLGSHRLVMRDRKYSEFRVKETGGRKYESYQRQQERISIDQEG